MDLKYTKTTLFLLFFFLFFIPHLQGDETTLQEILDSLGYDINVETDETGGETFEVSSEGKYLVNVLGGVTENRLSFGWYNADNPEEREILGEGEVIFPEGVQRIGFS